MATMVSYDTEGGSIFEYRIATVWRDASFSGNKKISVMGGDRTVFSGTLVIDSSGRISGDVLEISGSYEHGAEIGYLRDIRISASTMDAYAASYSDDQLRAVIFAGADTFTGGPAAETLYFYGGGDTITGGDGADYIISARGSADRIVFSGISDGSGDGANSGYDTVDWFEVGTDKIVISGALWSALDKNSDGALTETPTMLSTRVNGSLTDADYANFRAAVGTTNEGGIWVANNGTDTGIYLLAPPDGNSALQSWEVRLLGVVKDAILTRADIVV